MQYVYRVMQMINAAMCRRCNVDTFSPQTSQYTEPRVPAGPPNQQNTKTSSAFFRTGIQSSHSRLYFRSFAKFLNNFSKSRRQTRLSFGSSGFEQMCTALLRNCTTASGCQYSHIRSNANRFFSYQTDKV
jgi:hypothetical protein